MRILITGSPKAGKSRMAEFLAKLLRSPVRSTDEVKDLDWSEASLEVAEWFDWQPKDGPARTWIIEGVTIPRALRKWRQANPDQPPPFDWFILMREPREFLMEQGQKTMQKQVCGLADVLKEWIGERWIEI